MIERHMRTTKLDGLDIPFNAITDYQAGNGTSYTQYDSLNQEQLKDFMWRIADGTKDRYFTAFLIHHNTQNIVDSE